MKRFLLLIIAISLFASCDFRPVRPADTLVLRLKSSPSAFNPLMASDEVSRTVLFFIFEPLLERNKDTLKFEGRLARSWKENGKEVTFYLRPDVKWQNGKSFSADDIVYSFEKAKKMPAYGGYLTELEEITAVDEMTVKFVFKRPYFKILSICGSVPIIPAGSDLRSTVGTGPYKLEDGDSRRVAVIRNDDYWGKKPKIKRIEFAVIPDDGSAFQSLKKDSIDTMELTTLQWARQTNKNGFEKDFNKFKYYTPNFTFISWNMRTLIFSDERVRKAMTMLINREEILKQVLHNEGKVVSSSFYVFSPFYNKTITPYKYDPTKAVRLLEEAGWNSFDSEGIRVRNNKPFIFSYSYPSGATISRAVGVFLQGELRKIGIKMELRPLEGGTLLDIIRKRSFEAVALGFAPGLDEDPFMFWHCSQSNAGFNLSGFCSSEADDILKAGRTELNFSKRVGMFKELQNIIHKEQPVTFLFTTPSFVVSTKRLDVKLHHMGFDPTEWKFLPGPKIMEW